MKTILILLVVAFMQYTAFSKDIFESGKTQKQRIKISSYEKSDGTQLNFDDVNKKFKVIETKKEKSIQFQSSKTNFIQKKYIYHRADSKTYESTDLRNWNQSVKEIVIENNNKIVLDKVYKITPNPVVDYLNVRNLTGQKYEIYSMFGIKVMEGECHWKLDVSLLPPGIYLIKTEHILSKFIKI
jgi:hypothetical protein